MTERMRKADDPALRADITELRRKGKPIDRKAMAAKHGVTTSVVQVARSEIDQMLGREAGHGRRPGGRTVADFAGPQLRDYRTASRLMQDELGLMAKVSRGEIGHLELGHRKPTLKTLRNLEEALGIRAGWLQHLPSGTEAESRAWHEQNLAAYKDELHDAREAEAAAG